MEQKLAQLEDLQAIIAANTNLKERVQNENWTISYNKHADMLVMGGAFPIGSFYFPVHDTGVLARIDKNNKLYGFAIENTKFFMKENPEMALPLSFIVYPYRSYFIKLPLLFIAYHTIKSINAMKGIFSVSDFVAGQAAYN